MVSGSWRSATSDLAGARFTGGYGGHADPVRPVAVIAALVALAVAPAAVAGPVVNRAAVALANDPVYVDPSASTVTEAQGARIRSEIESRGHGPVYVAVLPRSALGEAGGSAVGIVDQLHSAL